MFSLRSESGGNQVFVTRNRICIIQIVYLKTVLYFFYDFEWWILDFQQILIGGRTKEKIMVNKAGSIDHSRNPAFSLVQIESNTHKYFPATQHKCWTSMSKYCCDVCSGRLLSNSKCRVLPFGISGSACLDPIKIPWFVIPRKAPHPETTGSQGITDTGRPRTH